MTNLFAVVVTWNGSGVVGRCLESLGRADVPIRTVVVDNASTDDTMEVVRATSAAASVFRLTRNLGFGRANNIGLRYAYDQGAENVLLINQDAWIDPSTPGRLRTLQERYQDSGIISPLHLDSSGQELDRRFAFHLGKTSTAPDILSDCFLGRGVRETYDVDFINAAIWMVSRRCLERVGLFNPSFRHYGEDREYTDRVRYLGLRVSLDTRSRAYHGRVCGGAGPGVERLLYRYQMAAEAQYRLSRKIGSTWFNIGSALASIVVGRGPGGGSWLGTAGMRARLLVSLLSTLPGATRNRRYAYRGGRAFFEEAERDAHRYMAP